MAYYKLVERAIEHAEKKAENGCTDTIEIINSLFEKFGEEIEKNTTLFFLNSGDFINRPLEEISKDIDCQMTVAEIMKIALHDHFCGEFMLISDMAICSAVLAKNELNR